MLLAHKIITQGFSSPATGNFDERRRIISAHTVEIVEAVLRFGPILRIQYASRRFVHDHQRHTEPVDLTDSYNNLAPPFDMFWMEYEGPFDGDDWGQTGCAFIAIDLRKQTVTENLKLATALSVAPNNALSIEDPEARWLVLFCPVLLGLTPPTPLFPPIWAGQYVVSQEGNALSSNYFCAHKELRRILEDTNLLAGTIGPCWEAHRLLHCKNIVMSEHDVRPRVRRQSTNRLGDKTDEYKYYTLAVKTAAAKRRPEIAAAQHLDLDAEGKALHLVRGNYATYTEDAPLFGRLVGTFFRPAHVRGDKDHGVIHKDYSVDISQKES